MSQDEFFEPIRAHATNIDAAEDEEQLVNPVTEIESLCMECHEQVSITLGRFA